jgi:signal transduction histidine kinase
VEALLGQVADHLRGLARAPAVQRREVGPMEALFREVAAEHPEIENLSAFAADGRVVAASVAAPAGAPVTVADRPWFRDVMATGQPAVSGFLVGKLTGQPVAVVAVPLRDPDGRVTGALAATLNLWGLHRPFQSLPLGEARTVTVVDGDGHVLSHAPRGGAWIGRRLPAPAGSAGPTVVQRLAWPEGGERIAALAPVAGTTWRVLVATPRAALEARVWKEVRAIALPLLVVLAVSTLAGFLVARRVWRPLRALTEAAARLPQGEEIPVRADSTDEVGDLARAFNAMAAQLTQSRASLERRVRELTTVTEAGELLTGTLEISGVLQRLTELARSRLGADVVRIWLRDDASGELRLSAEAGATGQTAGSRTRFEPGQGLVGWIVARREPLVIADLEADPRLANRDWAEAEGLHAFLGVPILLEDLVVGVLACMRREPRAFSPDDVTLARLFALPAAAALLNARLYAETRARAGELAERNRQLQLLHAAALAITVEHDLDRLLQRVVEVARELAGAAYGVFVVFHPDGRVRTMLTAGLTAEARARIATPPEGRGLLGYVFRHGETLRLDDLATHPAAVGFPPGHPPMRSLLALPVRLRGEPLGALYLTEKPGGFTTDDEALLATLASDAAVAIENARLMASLRQALEDLGAAQDQLVQGEALRAMGRLASGMAHHLNNILAVIQGRVMLLLREVGDPATRRALETVERATTRAAQVIRAVQGFSRVQPVAQAVPVDVNHLVTDALELTRPRWGDEAGREGIAIEARCEGGPVPPVAGDPASLRDVVVNLLLNAADALPAGGRITVRTWAAGDRVHCAVTDTGVGMSEEVRQRALEPFFTTKGPQSRGLGLSVIHGVVTRHGGTLAIESAPGEGTTVTVSLPVAPETAAPPAPAAAGPRRILVIDDEAEVRETLAELLAAQGHHVSQAASGTEGVALFSAGRHDLVFTDLGMPGMTGCQVAEAIRAVSPGTPVAVVTGWGDGHAPCPGHVTISKPFDLDAIAALVGRAPAG